MANVDDIFDLLDELADIDRALRVAANTVHAKHKDRIFGLGKAADNSAIGDYSRKPTYISPRNSPVALRPQGKTGETTFKDGTPHKTQYFGEGYFGFRQYAGRQTGTVDLRLSGQMENDYTVEPDGTGYASGFNNRTNFAKAKGNERHFGKVIFEASEDEIELFVKVFESELPR